jgi:hypothetical protein
MTKHYKGFYITHGKGFHITFPNKWTVSVQFGPANYCDNYNKEIGREEIASGKEGSETAEVAVLTPQHTMWEFPEGDTVLGYKTPLEVLQLMNLIASQP